MNSYRLKALLIPGLVVTGAVFNNFYALCSGNDDKIDKVAFSPNEFRKFPITKVITVSADTKKFEIALPSKDHEMGMTTSSLIMVKAPSTGKEVSRPYTPTTLNDEKGSFELVVKTYPGGAVSGYLHGLKVGDHVEVKGPYMKLKYTPNMKKHIGMLAGGTGITPMIQVIKEILKNKDDKTEITLVYSNHAETDILMKEEIDALAKKHKNFKVKYTLTKQKAGSYLHGRIDLNTVKSLLPPPSADTLIYVCGPPSFMKDISGDKGKNYTQGTVEGVLKAAGYNGHGVQVLRHYRYTVQE